MLQTLLPALLTAAAPSSLTLEGGTHNPHAPPIDFLEKAFLPLVNRMGPTVHVALERAGFYPAGGGRVFVNIEPVPKMLPIGILERGEIRRKLATAAVAALPGEIAKRELQKVEKLLGWSGEQLRIRQLPAEWGPGNLLTLEIHSEHVTEVFTGFGMKGVSAEAVAESAIRAARRYLVDGAPIGPHLADQLLLPLALAGGGSFHTQPPTRHTLTNIEIIRMFLPVRIEIHAAEKDCCIVEIGENQQGDPPGASLTRWSHHPPSDSRR